jgi:hypothetical protein
VWSSSGSRPEGKLRGGRLSLEGVGVLWVGQWRKHAGPDSQQKDLLRSKRTESWCQGIHWWA